MKTKDTNQRSTSHREHNVLSLFHSNPTLSSSSLVDRAVQHHNWQDPLQEQHHNILHQFHSNPILSSIIPVHIHR